jgi:hypothetical protein
MTITTEEAERLAERVEDEGGLSIVADDLRDLAAERDYLEKIALEAAQCHARETARAYKLQAENARLREALRAEVERLKAGGCARGQSTTQFCAEAVALQAENARLRGLLEEIGNLAESRSNRVDDLGFENARLREALKECADDLEAEIAHRFCDDADRYPSAKRRRDEDMAPVLKARAALGEKE